MSPKGKERSSLKQKSPTYIQSKTTQLKLATLILFRKEKPLVFVSVSGTM